MAMDINKVVCEAKQVRDLLYGDGYYCEDIVRCKYHTYLLDNKDNEKVLDDALSDSGIKLIVAPTGSGKSFSILSRAKELVAKEKDIKVVIALPTRALALQVSNNDGVYKLIGGDTLDQKSEIIATTYEKMFEIQDYIKMCRSLNKNVKIHLILDESHLFTTQHLFRKNSIMTIIEGIEKNFFHSVLLITATPSPMSLFRWEKVIQFEAMNPLRAIDTIEIVYVDDVLEYIKEIDYNKEFPFIRLNDKKRIDFLISQIGRKIGRITSDDKEGQLYKDIVDGAKIDGNIVDAIMTTSVLEAGVNVTDYPDNIVPIAAFTTNNISIDDIEQFLNRIRRVGAKHVKNARVVMKRYDDTMVNAQLMTCDRKTVLCIFKDVKVIRDNLYINDSFLMDCIEDGEYLIKIMIDNHFFFRSIRICSVGASDNQRYSKEDPIGLMYEGIVFRSFIEVFKKNLNQVSAFQQKLQDIVDVLNTKRNEMNQNNILSDDEIELMIIDDTSLIEKMTKAAIVDCGELGECLSFENGAIEVNKRLLYMISYNQYQRQYYHSMEYLTQELTKRMSTKVVVVDQKTSEKSYKASNDSSIWEDLEDLRNAIVCSDDYWRAIVGKESNYFLCANNHRNNIYQIRGVEHLMDIIKKLQKQGIEGKYALDILVESNEKREVTKRANDHKILVTNEMLAKFDGKDIEEIPLYNQNEKLQASIYCYLQSKGQKTYKVTSDLLEEILLFYVDTYPSLTKYPSCTKIKKLLYKMYHSKGNDTIRNQLKTL